MKPQSKTTTIEFQDNLLRVRLKSAPKKGKANKELIRLLSEIFRIKSSQILIIQGLKSAKKSIMLEGITLERVNDVLEQLTI